MNHKHWFLFFLVLFFAFLINNNLFTNNSRLITVNSYSVNGARQIASVGSDERVSTEDFLNKLKDRKPAHTKVFTDYSKLKYDLLMGKYDLRTSESQDGTKVISIDYIQSDEVNDEPIVISDDLLISEINKFNKSSLQAQKFEFKKDSRGRFLSVNISF